MSAEDKELLINEHSPESSSKNSSGDDTTALNGLDVEAQIHYGNDEITGGDGPSDDDENEYETEDEEEYDSYSGGDNEDDEVTLGSKLKKTGKVKKTGFSIQNDDDDGDEIRYDDFAVLGIIGVQPDCVFTKDSSVFSCFLVIIT